MLVEVKVPVLAESVPDATLLEWKKKPGEAVQQDEILIELETDKVVLEVPAPQSGVLSEILKNDGDVVLSQDVLAQIDTDATGVTPKASAAPAANAADSAPAVSPATAAKSAPPAPAADVAMGPAARKLVADNGLDASAIAGTGRNGLITKQDVLAHMESGGASAAPAASTAPPAAAPAAPAPAATASPAPVPGSRDERRVQMTRLRSRVAERLKDAQNTAAILTTFNEVNMEPVMSMRSKYKEKFEKTHGVKLGFMSFFAKAAVQALQRFPAVNAYIEGNELVYHDYCDIGVAVSSPRGLVVPVLRNVEAMSFAGIEQRIGEYGAAARDGSLGIDDLVGGTFTISNGGVFGSMLSTPILNPPQSAILGMHATQQRPVVENGEIVARPMMYLALSYDHRIVDGREAVLFLVAIKEAIEDPSRLLLDV